MSRSQINLQDAFLNHVRKEKIPVMVNLSGGGKVDGLVKGFDNFVILLKHEGQHLIYKHAINTIVPERPVELAGHSTPSQPEHHEAGIDAGRGVIHTEPEVTINTEVETPSVPPSESEEPWVEG